MNVVFLFWNNNSVEFHTVLGELEKLQVTAYRPSSERVE